MTRVILVNAALIGALVLSNGCGGPEPARQSSTTITTLAPQPATKTPRNSRPKPKRKTESLIDAKPQRDMKPRDNL